MKTKMFTLLTALFAIVMSAWSQITLQDPVITDSYIKFSGENVANNYRYTLDTYEWGDRGPQFQLTIEALDETRPALFTTADQNDPNHWEPQFRQYTKQLAGQEMTAQDNVKRLYVKNVPLLPNQFADYPYLKIIGIVAGSDYTIPDGCFSNGSRLETLDCNIQGTLILGTNIVNDKLGFTVKVYTEQSAEAWNAYRETTGAQFTVDNSEVVVDTGEPRILSVSGNATVNKDVNQEQALANQGSELQLVGAITRFLLNSFTAKTSGEVTELFMDYCVYPEGQGGQQHEWTHVYATNKGNGVWRYEGTAIDVLKGLESNKTYTMEFSFNTNPAGNKGERAHYPTNGQTIRIKFTTGDLSTGIETVSAVTVSYFYELNGRRLTGKPMQKGVYVKDGCKVLVK